MKVLITGGSRGIGAACVRHFSEQGDRVVFFYRSSDAAAEALARECGAEAIRVDIADPIAVKDAVARAEKLLGVGDMLAMTPASMELERVQGAWVKDDDIKNVVKFVSDQAPQHFNDTVLAESTDDSEEIDEDLEKITSEDRADIAPVIQKYLLPGDDDTMRRALEVVVLDRKASTSYLQRRLKIGYNRAAELIEEMEERGIVGPPSGSGAKRDILIFDGIDIG